MLTNVNKYKQIFKQMLTNLTLTNINKCLKILVNVKKCYIMETNVNKF